MKTFGKWNILAASVAAVFLAVALLGTTGCGKKKKSSPPPPPANTAPVATDDANTTLEGTAVTINVLANDTDADNDALTMSGYTMPQNGSLVDNGDGSFTYTPNAGFVGTDTFTYTISDGRDGTAAATVTITVNAIVLPPANNAPVASDDTVVREFGGAVTINVLANDTDVDGDTLTIASFTQPANGAAMDAGAGSLTYTPGVGVKGPDPFTYTISDGREGTATATVSVTTQLRAIELASVASDEAQAAGNSAAAAISSLGEFIAFQSDADDLVAVDGNNSTDIFVRSREAGTTARVSVDSVGVQGDGNSTSPAISADGRFVAFESLATNLVGTNDTNNSMDIFVHDRNTGTTERISVASDGTEGNNASSAPAISADGRFVAFQSDATNLVAGDANGRTDIFVHDRNTGTTERVSLGFGVGVESSGNSLAPSISADGRFVAFESVAQNLVDGGTSNRSHIFVHDRTAGTTVQASKNTAGAEADADSTDAAISPDGGFVAFESAANNLGVNDAFRHIFLRDLAGGTTTHVSVTSEGAANDHSSAPAISRDGRFVIFESKAITLVAGDTNARGDVFVRDMTTGTTARVSVTSQGAQVDDGISDAPAISADGLYAAFESGSANLVSVDANASNDIFAAPNPLSF
jgi:Tol biopolymer transport system component